MNFLKFFFPLILIARVFVGDAKPACKESKGDSDQPTKKRKLEEVVEIQKPNLPFGIIKYTSTFLDQSSRATLAATCKALQKSLGELHVVEKFYVTPQIFFDEKEFELFLKFVAKHQELKEIVFLPALPVYGKEDKWGHYFTEGDERAISSPEKLSSFTYDWYTNLNGGWLDKFNRLCKQVPANSNINVGLFIPQKNAAIVLEKIKQMSFGKQIVSQLFDYSPMHMVCHENNKPVYIFEIPTNFQANTWECGYRTARHARTVYLEMQEKSPNFLYRLNLKRPDEFEEFCQTLAGKCPRIFVNHKQNKRLHLGDIIELLDAVFEGKIEEVFNVLLIVQKDGSKFYNYDHGCKYGMARKNFSVEKPLLVIFKASAHCNCFVFTKTAIFVIDSSSACKYADPRLLINLYRYLISQSKHIFETEQAAAKTENPLIYCDVRNLHFDEH